MKAITSYIVYEDDQILVCHKPQGMAVQNAYIGVMDLECALKTYLAKKQPGKPPYLGIVHRLDQPVEGLIVFAKQPGAAKDLSAQIVKGKMKKEYLAVSNHISEEREVILEDVVRKDGKTHRSQIVPSGTAGGKKARLSYRLLAKKEGQGLYQITLFTGRYHQIRVQMAGAGLPLMGDRKYNGEECAPGTPNLALCAWRLSFTHPKTKKQMEFQVQPENPAFENFKEEWLEI